MALSLMADHGLWVSAGLSQIISNVPAAVLLSHFTGAWQPLLVGVNIGGAGTLVGSLASSSRCSTSPACANLPPSDRVARAIHWSLPRPVQRAELWFPGHSLDCLRDGVFLLEKYFDFERFF